MDSFHTSAKKFAWPALSTIGVSLITLVVVLMPFHAFITVGVASVAGHYTLLRLWKEMLLLALVGIAAIVVCRDRALWRELKQSRLFWCCVAYCALLVLLGLMALARHQVDGVALADGLVIDLRLVVFLVVVQIFASKSSKLQATWHRLLLWPAAAVIVFGLLQLLVLPANVLSHVGYGPSAITPYELVDQNSQFVRVQSTLRGANPLGAYLVLVLTAIAILMFSKRQMGRRVQLGSSLVIGVIVLYGTYSRSAYIGTFVALLVLVGLMLRGYRVWRVLLASFIVVCLIGVLAAFALRHNSRFENTFFHTSQHSQSLHSSNQDRSSSLKRGVHDVVHQPLGLGPGTAGPASAHNDHPARIAENYYLQIGQEAGWVGLALFIAINGLVIEQLWHRRQDRLSLALLASFAGLLVVNMLSHAWADDTLAYVWWGLAGIALAPIMQTKAAQHAKQKISKKSKAAA